MFESHPIYNLIVVDVLFLSTFPSSSSRSSSQFFPSSGSISLACSFFLYVMIGGDCVVIGGDCVVIGGDYVVIGGYGVVVGGYGVTIGGDCVVIGGSDPIGLKTR